MVGCVECLVVFATTRVACLYSRFLLIFVISGFAGPYVQLSAGGRIGLVRYCALTRHRYVVLLDKTCFSLHMLLV